MIISILQYFSIKINIDEASYIVRELLSWGFGNTTEKKFPSPRL